MVKSAKRVMEIFEHLASSPLPATSTEVADTLGYPRSSTSVLMRTLRDMRYLSYDASSRAYGPTIRLSLLGARLRGEGIGANELTQYMITLQDECGANVLLGAENRVHAQYIQFLPSPKKGFGMRPATLRPIGRCAIGRALLLGRTDEEVARLARRINAMGDPAARVDLATLLEELRLARRSGVAFSDNSAVQGTAGLAVPLEGPGMSMAMALGVAGPISFIRRRRKLLSEMLLKKAREIRVYAKAEAERHDWGKHGDR